MRAAAVVRTGKKKARRLNFKRFIPMLALVLVAVGILGYFANRYLEKRTYKLAYPEEIKASAGEFGLDPYLVAAVIFAESSGNPAAVSPKGAVGLMQIMPDTGDWIAEKLSLADHSTEKLTEASHNIRLGCWYLAYLLDKYGDDREIALAAYNAGPGNVDKWLGDERYGENGKLTNIPFEETRNYVARVKAALKKYTELYEGELD